MNETEVGALRQKLASRVRSDDYRQRRKELDARALEYKIASDVTVEPMTANGVRAEWTSTPNDARDAALVWLHGVVNHGVPPHLVEDTFAVAALPGHTASRHQPQRRVTL